MTPANEAMLTTLLDQLAARMLADQEANREQFRIIHEDFRRDRREAMTAIEAMRARLDDAMKDGFEELHKVVSEVCDRGGVEHAQIVANHDALSGVVASLVEWKKEQDAIDVGRKQIIDGAKGRFAYFSQYGIPALCLLVGIIGWFKDDLPQIEIRPAAHTAH